MSKKSLPGLKPASQGPEIPIHFGDQPDVAVDSQGNVHIVAFFPEDFPMGPGEREIYYTMLDGGTGNTLIAPTRLTPDDTFASTRLAIVVDSEDMVHITWHDERWPTGPDPFNAYITYHLCPNVF